MSSRVVSFRLPARLAAVVRSQTHGKLSLSRALSWFVDAAAHNPQLVVTLGNCPGHRDAKLDFRLSRGVYAALEAACKQAKLSLSVYISKALYHFCETKTVWVIKQDGHYTLAVHHE